MQQGKTVLFTVLDWGLGHATRSIPIIHAFLRKGFQVSIAGEGNSLLLLKKEFPELSFYPLDGIQVSYNNSSLDVLLKTPSLLKSIKKEHAQFIELCNHINPQMIVSDNRYGAWHPTIPSIFIGHQLYLQAPNAFSKFVEPFLFYLHKKFLKRFTKIWIPDFPGNNNLSGVLSHHSSIHRNFKCEFIGALSRLNKEESNHPDNAYEIAVLISGPEPQRSYFEEACINEAKRVNKKTIIVRGKPSEEKKSTDGNITMVSHLDNQELSSVLSQAKYIVCRSGYSTLMDLAKLNKTALCIPTPGQTEQLYLAKHLSNQHKIIFQEQHQMNWEIGFQKLSDVGQLSFSSDDLLNQAITKLSF
jgi:uncharacterized protein (TIGR00661 family)